MANLTINTALGEVKAFFSFVEDNSPAAALIRLHAWVAGAATDDDIRDDDTIAELEISVNEVTNTGYANIALDETDLTITIDDTANDITIFITDQVMASVGAGDVWSDISACYDADGLDTDATMLALLWWDFVVTPSGGDITFDFDDVNGVWSASN